MKKFIGSIFVCSILATSVMAEATMHPNPSDVLSKGIILSVQNSNNGKHVKFIVAYLGDIFMCHHIDEGFSESYFYCAFSRRFTK